MSKWGRRFSSVLLALALVVGFVPVVRLSVNAASVPAGYTPIYTAQDLANVSKNLSGKFFLMNDIDLASWGNWKPIASDWIPGGGEWEFSGVFDGNNHVIRNIKIDVNSPGQTARIGLFGEVAKGAVIKNLGVLNGKIKLSTNSGGAGGIAGSAWNSTFSNCFAIVDIEVSSSSGGSYMDGVALYAGGIIGDAVATSIRDSYHVGNISMNTSHSSVVLYAGGITGSITNYVGNAEDIYIRNCYNAGKISVAFASTQSNGYAGGITGSLFHDENNNVIFDSVYFENNVSRAIGEDSFRGDSKGNAIPLTGQQMRDQSSFSGFDFSNTWEMEPNGYPKLRGMPGHKPAESRTEATSLSKPTTTKPVLTTRPPATTKPGTTVDKKISLPIPEQSNRFEVTWNPNFFTQSSYNSYNARSHNLATLSSALSWVAYNENYIREAFSSLEITDSESFNYDKSKVQGKHTVAYAFGTREIPVNGEKYHLVIVAVRGTTGLDEWESNFAIDVNNTQEHQPFVRAKDDVAKNLDAFIRDRQLPHDNVKILITGHSRGAAVANLLAADLTREAKYAQAENIYAFTFATPNVTKKAEARDGASLYKNIYNFVNAEDFVPYLPLSGAGWDYWKYGTTYMFPSFDVPLRHEKLLVAVKTTYQSLAQKRLIEYVAGPSVVVGAINYMRTDISPTAEVFDMPIKKTITRFIPTGVGGMGGMREEKHEETYIAPKEFMRQLALAQGGNDAQKQEAEEFIKSYLMDSVYGNFAWFLGIHKDCIGNYHLMPIYFSWMQNIGSYSGGIDLLRKDITIKKTRIACPVDVEVYNSKGQLVGRVIDNKVDESITSEVAIFIQGEEKHVYMSSSDRYDIRIIGTETGTMDYTIEEIGIASAVSTVQKEYKDVILEAGKTFSSAVSQKKPVRLYLKDGKRTIGEVMEDGSEVEKNSLNTILIIGACALVLIGIIVALSKRKRRR